MKYLITGGAGFIGSHLSDLLISKGHHVTILDNLSTGSWDNIAHLENHPNFTPVIDSILNETVLDRLVSLCDVVVHLAAAVGVQLIVNDPFHTIRTNVIGTDGVLKAACRYRKKTVVASTSEIYGKNSKVPFCEDDDTTSGPTTKQRWAYACTKAMDEFAAFACARTHQLPVIIARFFNTVGPRQKGQYGMVIPTLMKQALLGKDITVYGTGDQSRCFNNVSVAVDALDKLIQTDEAVGQVYNIGSDEQVSINELAQRIIDITGSTSKIVHIPYDQAYQEGFEDMMVRVPSIDKIKSVIDYQLNKTLDDTLKEVQKDIRERLDKGSLA